MKSVLSFLLSMLIILGLYIFAISDDEDAPASGVAQPSEPKDEEASYSPINYDKPKAIWLSQFDMREIYTCDGAQRDVREYTALTERVISNLTSIGINTVFIQLRPNGDSIYPSEIYPASRYATGEYGNEFSYDPFEIFLSLAHKEGLSVHAWINPLRCMSAESIGMIPERYAIRRWYSEGRYVKEVGGYLYLDPAYEETRSLVCSGIAEIIKSYDIDGIHIDDYFYPTTDESFDMDSYLTQNPSGLSLEDFRREQTNTLVRSINETVKRQNALLLFGVSPSGNSARNYSELFADVEEWCEAGYVDYICPQIYFGFEHATHPFERVLCEFSELSQRCDVSLIVGITLEKAANGTLGVGDTWAGTGAREWIEQKNIIKRSLECVMALDDDSGVALFSYRLLFDPITSERKDEVREEYESFLPVFKAM